MARERRGQHLRPGPRFIRGFHSSCDIGRYCTVHRNLAPGSCFAHPLAGLVYNVLRTLGRPIELSGLTSIAADLAGIREPSYISRSGASPDRGDPELADLPGDPSPSVVRRLELRERVEMLWSEVLLLSSRHRVALLLSARASSGAAIWLVVDLGVASFRDVASTLEMTMEELAELWNRLPLDDREIGIRLRSGASAGDQSSLYRQTKLIRRESPPASRTAYRDYEQRIANKEYERLIIRNRGMTPHLNSSQIADYLDRSLLPAGVMALLRHVET